MSVSAMYSTFVTRTHPMYADTFKKRIHFKKTFTPVVSAMLVILPQIVLVPL